MSDDTGLTPMAEGTAQLHELFTTLMESGFTELQACRIVGVMLATSSN